ncbi:MAG: hypothetical protein FGM46_10775, partial [Ferruginibacter sp.]|nr:hypothetical protein [Ferruginibacter sp.]
MNILESLMSEKPKNEFIKSLHQQYCNRGGLSKKQLEGLYGKAKQSGIVSPAKLATLEAIIKKKPTRYKSEKIKSIAEPQKESQTMQLLQQILLKYPHHKMALFLIAKNKNKNSLT